MIAINITSNTSHLIADDSASVELKRAYSTAMRDRSSILAARVATDTLVTLVTELALPSLMDRAVRAAAASGKSVADELYALRLEFSSHAANANSETRAYAEYCATRREEVGPILVASMNELQTLEIKEDELKGRIAGFEQARQRCAAGYEEAGLSPADIALVGIKPTHEDRARWRLQLAHTCAREAGIKAFLKSAPEYDVSLLNVARSAEPTQV